MTLLSRLLFVLSALLLLPSRGEAEGLVQLSLNGAIDAKGGATVEVQWGHWTGKESRDTHLRLHLAQDTSSFELASLLVMRLRARGASVLFPAEKTGATGPVHLYVESTTQVNLRLGHGMWATVTLCDSGPEKVRFLKPQVARDGAQITINTSTFQAHTKMTASILLEHDMDALANTATVCETLFNQGLSKGLVCDRPSADSWRPAKGSDGALVTGCSIELLAPGADWGLQVSLSVPTN